MPGMGISFTPGQDNGQQISPVQQAIQMLSLRLPRLSGAQGIAPGPLMNSPGAQGLSPDVLRTILQIAGMAGGSGPMGGPGGAPPPSQPSAPFPMPRVIPGEDQKATMPSQPAPGIQMPPYAQRSPNVFGSQQQPVPPDAPNLDFTRPQNGPGFRRMF